LLYVPDFKFDRSHRLLWRGLILTRLLAQIGRREVKDNMVDALLLSCKPCVVKAASRKPSPRLAPAKLMQWTLQSRRSALASGRSRAAHTGQWRQHAP